MDLGTGAHAASGWEWTILIVHFLLLALLSVFGAHRLFHLITYGWRLGRVAREMPPQGFPSKTFLPRVTVQLPIYNEKYVVERLLDQVSRLDWPTDHLQIQLIDDSTDETSAIARRKIAELGARGVAIEHVMRRDRQGYKAGGLAHATATATGEFVAIFDADFMPHPDFLHRTIPYFSDPNVGMVQTRWSYLNRERNLLTRIQTIMLDAHFAVEQVIRSRSGAFFNFNGTGGVWRKTAIEQAGGWQFDTLTEDTDLSYRAQMAGWKFLYLDDVECPSELPSDMSAFKTQQHRWAKGAIQVMKKVLPELLRSDHPLHVKIEAAFHLSGNIAYLLTLISAVFFLVPAIYIRESHDFGSWLWLDVALLLFTSLSHLFYYLYSQYRLRSPLLKRALLLPMVFAVAIGLCVNNARAVVEALVRHASGFVRTPKTGDRSGKDTALARQVRFDYSAISPRWTDRAELVLGLSALAFMILGAFAQLWLGAALLMPFAIGFLYTGGQSVLTRRADRKSRNIAPRVEASDRVGL